MANQTGRHFLQIPGPTPVPERILNAMSRQMLDHRGPTFGEFGLKLLADVKTIFKTTNPVIIYPVLRDGRVGGRLRQHAVAGRPCPHRRDGPVRRPVAQHGRAAGPQARGYPDRLAQRRRRQCKLEARLKKDKAHDIKAVCVVHNETSTGARTWIDEIRKAMDAAKHPALLMVDAVSSLAAMDFRHDEWGVDVTVSGSQKGLMLPPGLSFTAVSQKALAASKKATLPRSYWNWEDMIAINAAGTFPYTPAIGQLYGLAEAIAMLHEEGLDNVFARHERLAEATRRAVRGWGLETWCRDPRSHSPAVTAVAMPDGHNADAYRKLVLENFNMSLGTGLNKLAGKAFRIGHLGYTNELTVLGALAGVEMGLELAGVPHEKGGVAAAMTYLSETVRPATAKAA